MNQCFFYLLLVSLLFTSCNLEEEINELTPSTALASIEVIVGECVSQSCDTHKLISGLEVRIYANREDQEYFSDHIAMDHTNLDGSVVFTGIQEDCVYITVLANNNLLESKETTPPNTRSIHYVFF